MTPTPKTSRENILQMLANNCFGDLVDGQSADVSRQEQLNRALQLACECGYQDLVQKFHGDGAQIIGNPEPLCIAADFDELEIAQYLLENGADINAKAKQLGQTPLMDAAGSASLNVFRYLLENGADTKAVCNDGMTALDWAKMGRNSATDIADDQTILNDYDAVIDLLLSALDTG